MRSLFSRLLASYVALVVATLLLLGGALGIFFTRYETHRRTAELTARGHRIAALVLEEDILGAMAERRRPITPFLDTLDEAMDARIWVVDRNGLIRMTSTPHRQWRGATMEWDELEQLAKGQVVTQMGDFPLVGPGISVAVPVIRRRDPEGGAAGIAGGLPQNPPPGVLGAVILHAPLRGFWTNINEARAMTLYAGLLAIGLATAMGYYFSLRLSRPIKQMTASVQAMQAGNFQARVDGPLTDDEIGDLARGFNQMAARLGDSIEALHRETRKIEAILHAMTEGVVAVDGEGRIILVNPAFERMVGAGAQDLLHRPASEAIAPAALRECLEPANLPVEPVQRRICIGENTYRLTVTPLQRARGVPLGAVGVLQDVTEQEKLERLRRDFLANVSHDLRTPLTTLRGFLQAIAEGIVTDPASTRASAQAMLKETLRLIRLVNTLLDLSRLQSGSLQLHLEPVQLQPLVEDLMAPFLVWAEEQGTDLQAHVADDLPPLWADPDRLEQILGNLLENGMKFAGRGGAVTLSAGWDATRSGVTIRVSDTGPGIPPEDLPYIWERFYKGDKSRASGLNSGAGLGLVIVKDLVQAHGGRAWVQSTPGEGATFFVWFPVGPPEKLPASGPGPRVGTRL